MKMQVLGCSAVELPGSRLSSFLIDEKLLLDAGTIGTVLNEEQQWRINHVFLTHAHLDHIKDLPFFADNISINNKKRHVKVISTPKVIHALKTNLFNNIVWPDFTRIPDTRNPIIKLQTIDNGRTVRVDGYKITAYNVNHTVPAVGYLVENKRGRKLLYTGDTGPNETIWNILEGIKIHAVVIEVSFPNRYKRRALQTGHLTPGLLKNELGMIMKITDRIYVTHTKPVYKKRIKEELKNLHMNNIKILEDGEIYEI